MSDEIIEVLEYMCSKFGLAVDWTSENALPYLQMLCDKYINWEIATSIAWIVIFIGVIAFALSVCKKVKWDVEVICPSILLIIILIFASGVQVFDIIKCITFPEMKIYEYITNLLANI